MVLAAGEGTRMASRSTAKVLHGFAGRSLLGHVLAAAGPLLADTTVVVVGHRREDVAAHVADICPSATCAVQQVQLGTGHAVAVALQAVPPQLVGSRPGTVLVMPGDAPLLSTATLDLLLHEHRTSGAAATMLTSVLADPDGYGRVIRAGNGSVERVVEHKDATPSEREVHEVSALVYAFDHALLADALGRLTTANSQGEQYLPDVVSILVGDGHPVGAVQAPADETAGVNDRVQLAQAHRLYNLRLLEAHMRAGVTVVDPASTWVDADVLLAADVSLLPSVELHGATSIGEGAEIGPQVTLTDTHVGPGARISRAVAVGAQVGAGTTVGPFAYLRPGTVLADAAHVGTFVEVKNSDIGTGTKVPHLSYVGDATIGEHTNIGAATVFVNYDGVAKHRSTIGDHARTGADNMFVAPVHVGDGAYTAAGSVITNDIPAGAMGVARASQRNVEGWVLRKRSGTAAAQAAQAAGAAAESDAAKAVAEDTAE
ncbi:MAG: bifunctional UDP-N-acetylglucosamine diphosphorylase/glucosamine-1-phosphate N-acetyltransferase GlmU [Actinomycetota bacterium]|nr:bifunctional UDP-N-acetylglucosamine diphosphorylase/glucosamine-1-phosphate N-acetyltransferase GlmU [Actinomycetota bacterium]